LRETFPNLPGAVAPGRRQNVAVLQHVAFIRAFGPVPRTLRSVNARCVEDLMPAAVEDSGFQAFQIRQELGIAIGV